MGIHVYETHSQNMYMRFISKTVMNAQGFTSEGKDVILSLCKASFLYMGNFYIRCEVITGYHSGDS